MSEIAQKGGKCFISNVVSLLRLENIKERWKKKKMSSKYKKYI